MKSKKLLLSLVALLGLAACAPTTTAPTESVPPTSEDEPVKPSYPDDSLFDQHDEIEDFYENGKIATFQAPDPFVLRANGWYYLYYTTGGAGIRAYKSKDLMHWQTVRGKGCTEGFVYEYSKDEGVATPVGYLYNKAGTLVQTLFAPKNYKGTVEVDTSVDVSDLVGEHYIRLEIKQAGYGYNGWGKVILQEFKFYH